ncbi:MAG TPA: hypothetical protein VHC86_14685 [Opitutaceae bacterium]|nr:hypothetical protein [Opitutaceae bacterium]
MTKTKPTVFLIAGLLALTAAASASAQTTPPPAVTAPSGGLLGQDYLGLTDTYLRHNQGAPVVDHDYGFVFNQAVAPGLDATASYDWLTGSGLGVHDWRQQALIGANWFERYSWGRPFVGGEAGWAWQRFNGQFDNGFTYRLTAGVEFVAQGGWAFTPYAQYQQWHALSTANWASHDWNFGIKASYRVSPRLSLILNPQLDQYRNVGYQAGIALHF